MRNLIFTFTLFLFCFRNVEAMYQEAQVKLVPLSRLIKNIEGLANGKNKRNREDYSFQLARLYAMAYASNKTESSKIESVEGKIYEENKKYEDWKGTEVAWFDYEPKVVPFKKEKPSLPAQNSASAEYLDKAIKVYESALKEFPKNTRLQLGYGWCLMEAGKKEKAIEALRKALDLAYESEKKYGGMGPVVTSEAAEYLISLLDSEKDKSEIKKIKEKVKKAESIPRALTPLILPLGPQTDFASLTANTPYVPFDLDGTGIKKKWKWISKDAGWLVYTEGEKVNSALQMFGNVSFWIFWDNGYEALKALDDNQDGIVSGPEAANLKIWNDKNQDGISEDGEMYTFDELGIEGIKVNYAKNKNGILENKQGIIFKNGTTKPTYDFVSSEEK